MVTQSPAGPIESLNKSRMVSVYWRLHTNKDGSTVWIKTAPLPSDPVSKEMYLKKGFRLTPPGEETPAVAVVDAEKDNLYKEITQLRGEIQRLKKGEVNSGIRRDS